MPLDPTAQYPAAIPSTIPNIAATDLEDVDGKEHDLLHDRMANELVAMATALGTSPAGKLYPDVKTRVTKIEERGVFYNVKTDGGCVGNGVDDDSAALKTIFPANPSTFPGKRKVFFPPGRYKIGNAANLPLYIPTACTIEGVTEHDPGGSGSSNAASIIDASGLGGISGTLFKCNGSTNVADREDHTKRIEFWHLSRMRMIGPNAVNTMRGLEVIMGTSATIDDCAFWGWGGGGIYSTGWWDSIIRNCRFDWCGGRNTGVAALHLICSPYDNINSMLIDKCTFETNRDRDILIDGLPGTGITWANKIRIRNAKCENETQIPNAGGWARQFFHSIDYLVLEDSDFQIGSFQDAAPLPGAQVQGIYVNLVNGMFRNLMLSMGPDGGRGQTVSDYLVFDNNGTAPPSSYAILLDGITCATTDAVNKPSGAFIRWLNSNRAWRGARWLGNNPAGATLETGAPSTILTTD